MGNRTTIKKPQVRTAQLDEVICSTIENQKGESLIGVLVSAAIMGILVLIMASIFEYQNRETRAISEKLGSTDLEKTLVSAFADGSVCQYVLNNPSSLTFDSTAVSVSTPQVINVNRPIYASINLGPPLTLGPIIAQNGQAGSGYSGTLIVNSIQLSVNGAPNPMPPPGPSVTFTGNWLVGFDSSKTVRPLKPATISTTLTVDTTTPSSAKITKCQGGIGVAGIGLTCVERRSTTATKGDCGFSSQVNCLPGEQALTGGAYGGGNDAIQNSEFLLSGAVPVGWQVTYLDVAGGATCSGNPCTSNGTKVSGNPPQFPIGGPSTCGSSYMSGGAWAFCCH